MRSTPLLFRQLATVRAVSASVVMVALVAASATVVAVTAGHADRAEASTEEVYARPTDGVFHLEGHGWGHGHGLSQWGAQGAATHGVSYGHILASYYPNTQAATIANRPIRVLLSVNDGIDLRVDPATGLTATDAASGARAVLPGGPQRWRVVVDPNGLHVQSFGSGHWSPFALSGRRTLLGPVRFSSSQPTLRLTLPDNTQRDYRGTLAAVRTGTGSMATVLTLSMEDYLLGVVPRESPAYFAPEALKAQAVAARSYSAWKRDHAPADAPWDICDSTWCQVFGGTRLIVANSTIALESPSTTAAVQETAGQVRTYNGSPIFAEFSSSNGGWSTDGGQPYLSAHADPWDGLAGSELHSWHATLRASDLEERYGSQGLAHFLVMRILRRDGHGEWGGRVDAIVLEGTNARGEPVSVDATGGGIYLSHTWPAYGDGLRSNWWHIISPLASIVVAQSRVTPVIRPPGGAQGDLTASFKNTGLSSWPVAGLHLVVVPGAGPDPLAEGSRLPGDFVGNRTHPGASSVAPGDIVDLRVHVDAAEASAGVHTLRYRLRLGSGEVFGSIVTWSLPVLTPLFTGRLAAAPAPSPDSFSAHGPGSAPPSVSSDGTVLVARSGSTRVRLLVRNTGNIAWPVDAGVRLGTSDVRSRESISAGGDWLSAARASTLSGVVGLTGARFVRPGQVGIFEVTIHGNGVPAGVAMESFEPVWDPLHWIDGSLVTLRVIRYDSARPRAAELVSGPVASITLQSYPGATTTLVVRARNVGGQPWLVGRELLGTAGPRNRVDNFRTSAWLGATRATALVDNRSRPGVGAVWPGEIGEWRVPLSAATVEAGRYVEAFQAVTGVTWFGPVFSTTVTVHPAAFSGDLVGTSGLGAIARRGTATMWFDVRNTSTVSWPVNGVVHSAARSGTAARASDWLSIARPGSISENRSAPGANWVLPGQVARFEVTIAGNGRPAGTYRDTFGFGWEGWRAGESQAVLTYTLR